MSNEKQTMGSVPPYAAHPGAPSGSVPAGSPAGGPGPSPYGQPGGASPPIMTPQSTGQGPAPPSYTSPPPQQGYGFPPPQGGPSAQAAPHGGPSPAGQQPFSPPGGNPGLHQQGGIPMQNMHPQGQQQIPQGQNMPQSPSQKPGQGTLFGGQPGQPQQGQPQQQHQSYYQPQQQQQPQVVHPQQTNSMYQTALPLHGLTSSAAPVDCPNCKQRGLTRIAMHSGNTTHAWALAACVCLCLGCIPYLISGLKDVEHYCSNCGVRLATWHNSGRTDVAMHA